MGVDLAGVPSQLELRRSLCGATGRIEALAVAPGIPDLAAQEKRDRADAGSYQALFDSGLLVVADGLRVQKPEQLWDMIKERWGIPVGIVCDLFRLPELQDAIGRVVAVEPRRSRWSESSQDIRALQAGAKDGPLSVAEADRPLLAASLSVAMVKHDDAGNIRLQKSGVNNCARDDVAAALVFAAGAFDRAERKPSGTAHVIV